MMLVIKILEIRVITMPEIMTDNEAESYIIFLLKTKGPLTTKTIEDHTKSEGRQCPDGTLQFLTKLRFSGKIKGEVSIEKRTWVWWVEDK